MYDVSQINKSYVSEYLCLKTKSKSLKLNKNNSFKRNRKDLITCTKTNIIKQQKN